MAVSDKLLEDLLERVRRLEKTQESPKDEILAGLDRMSFGNLIATNAAISLLIEKKVFTTEELQKASLQEQQRLDSMIREKSTPKEDISGSQANEDTEEGSGGTEERQ